MKTWMITLPFLFAAGLATAADPAPAPAPKAEAAPAAEQPAPAKPAMARHHRAKHHEARHLPKGDLRQCLELKDNQAIIACAEARHRR